MRTPTSRLYLALSLALALGCTGGGSSGSGSGSSGVSAGATGSTGASGSTGTTTSSGSSVGSTGSSSGSGAGTTGASSGSGAGTSTGGAGFALAVESSALMVRQGASADLQITVNRTGGFAGDVTLSATSLPSGVTASFAPTTLTGAETSSTLTLTADPTASTGDRTILVHAASSGRPSQTSDVVLTVAVPAGQGIGVVPSTAALTVGRGQTAYVVLKTSSLGGYLGYPTISTSGAPAGVTVQVGAEPYWLDTYDWEVPGVYPEVRVVADAAAPLGTFTLSILFHDTTPGVADGTATLPISVVDPQAASNPAWTDLVAGHGQTCGLRADGKTYCWGADVPDLKGGVDRGVPFAAAGDPAFTQITVGFYGGCGVTASQAAFCWGINSSGEAGTGTTDTVKEPTAVLGGLSFASVSMGASHTCGLTPAGKAYCWGSQLDGRLGDGVIGTTNADLQTQPVEVQGGLTFTRIAASFDHTCALDAAGAAWCWGDNASGELGDGTATNTRAAPVAVGGGHAFTQLALGVNFTCGLQADGRVFCWGYSTSLGTGTTSGTNVTQPQELQTGLTYAWLSAYNHNACLVDTTGQAWCWGWGNSGELGNGQTGFSANSGTPVAVSGGLTFSRVDVGDEYACGVTTGGVAYCWGYNNSSQLGDGTRDTRSLPTLVQTF